MSSSIPPRCSCGASHRPEDCPERDSIVGPAIAPLSTEIPRTTPAQGSFRVPEFEVIGPTPAPTTTDPRARARIANSQRRIARRRAFTQIASWTVLVFAVGASMVVATTLIRRASQRAAAPAPPVVEVPEEPPSRRRARAEALVADGDAWLRRDPSRAGELFEDALTLDPTNAAANFGLGVTLLQRAAPDRAVPYLCAAHRTAVGALRRDVEVVLDERAIDCP